MSCYRRRWERIVERRRRKHLWQSDVHADITCTPSSDPPTPTLKHHQARLSWLLWHRSAWLGWGSSIVCERCLHGSSS